MNPTEQSSQSLSQNPQETADEPCDYNGYQIEKVRQLAFKLNSECYSYLTKELWEMALELPSRWDEEKFADILQRICQVSYYRKNLPQPLSRLLEIFLGKAGEIGEVRPLVSDLHYILNNDDTNKLLEMVSEPLSRWDEDKIANILSNVNQRYKEEAHKQDSRSHAEGILSDLTEIFPGKAEKREKIRQLASKLYFIWDSDQTKRLLEMVLEWSTQWDEEEFTDILCYLCQICPPIIESIDQLFEIIISGTEKEKVEKIDQLALKLLQSHSGKDNDDKIDKFFAMMSDSPLLWDREKAYDILNDLRQSYREAQPLLAKLFRIFPGKAVKSPVHVHPMHRQADPHYPVWMQDEFEHFAICSTCPRYITEHHFYECHFCPTRNRLCTNCAESGDKSEATYHSKAILTLHKDEGFLIENKSCSLCSKDIKKIAYHCSTCRLNMHPSCAKAPLQLTVDPRKIHEHTLSVIPSCILFTCDACGLTDGGCLCVCHQCRFLVHKKCTFLPGEVKITGHYKHRISLTFSRRRLPGKSWSCGVCLQTVDENYGAYSCKEIECNYAVHSRCLLKKGVWDGKDVQGEPEKETYNENPLFKRITEKSCLSQNLHSLCEIINNEDKSKRKLCRACILPVNSSPYYGCTICGDFFLHGRCGNLFEKKTNPIHVHPLTLETIYTSKGYFTCSACREWCNGFYYCCEDCKQDGEYFEVDIRCASLLDDGSKLLSFHEHPLVSKLLVEGGPEDKCCDFCGEPIKRVFLTCNCCVDDNVIIVCFACANLPSELSYKFDDHPLKLCFQDDHEEDAANRGYCCEICEFEIDPKSRRLFYACDDCGVTVHVKCVFGDLSYMSIGRSIQPGWKEYNIVSNDRPSRPNCQECGRRCQQTSYLKHKDDSNKYSCSVSCFKKQWFL